MGERYEWEQDTPAYPCPWTPAMNAYRDPDTEQWMEWSANEWKYLPANGLKQATAPFQG